MFSSVRSPFGLGMVSAGSPVAAPSRKTFHDGGTAAASYWNLMQLSKSPAAMRNSYSVPSAVAFLTRPFFAGSIILT